MSVTHREVWLRIKNLSIDLRSYACTLGKVLLAHSQASAH